MPDKDGDDDKKSTKDVVNKKQKQMMNKEEYTIEMVRKIKKKISTRTVYPTVAQNKVKNEVISDTGISNKNPVKKKLQKNNLDEEGYDIARDEGRVRPSKDKKDATTMPVSDEVKKTRKVNKGPSALERVKSDIEKKYGKGAIMNVGKKKANEELDLTKVAEAFGGYIIESRKSKGGGAGTGSNGEIPQSVKNVRQGIKDLDATQPIRDAKGNIIVNPPEDTEDSIRGKKRIVTSTPSLSRNIPKNQRISSDDAEAQAKAQAETEKRIKDAKKSGSPVGFDTKTTKSTVNPKGMKVDDEGNIILNPPDQTPENIERVKQTPDYQKAKKRGRTPLIDQDKFSTDTRTIDQDRVTRSKGDGRKAGRRGKTVTYTSQKKPKVTSVMDFGRKTDTRSSIDPVPTPKGPVQGPKRGRSKTATQNRILQKVRMTSRRVKRPVQRVVKPATVATRKSLTATAKGIKKNPFAAIVGASVAKDTFFPAALPKPPTVSGGKVGRRTAG